MAEKDYPYKVSASIITYNQVDYIRKAVDSAIAQQVDFPYEIIIGDDCSTDGTREILLDYKQRYPDLIKLNLQEEHDEECIAGRRNNITNIRSAQGQYIAFCDGDDYWISKDKLQKQADFMDTHPDYSFCCTDALIIHEDSNKRFLQSDKTLAMRKSCTFTYRDVVKEDFKVITPSTFFRGKYFMSLPQWFNKVYLADLFLQLMALEQGPGKYLKELKVGKVWAKNSICKHYLSGRMWIEVKRHDNAVICKQFSNQETMPYSYKSKFFMASALRFKRQKKYTKMILCIYKVYKYDPTLIAHWLKLAEEQTRGIFKKVSLSIVLKFMRIMSSGNIK